MEHTADWGGVIPEEMCWKQRKFHAIPSGLVPTFYMRFVIDNHFSYITKFTYIVQSILAVNVTVSAMNVLPAGRLFFLFPFLSFS